MARTRLDWLLTDIPVGSSSKEVMVGKLRLVIGVFEQPLALIKALDELLSQGFVESDLCVSGSSDAVSLAGDFFCTQTHPDPR